MRFIAAIAAVAALALAAGCATANKLIGTWEAEIELFGSKGLATQTILPDGTFTTTNSISLGGNELKTTTKGTWESATDDSLTLTIQDVSMEGLPDGAESQVKSMIDGQKDKPHTLTLKWNGPDEFTASGGPQMAPSVVFKRKK